MKPNASPFQGIEAVAVVPESALGAGAQAVRAVYYAMVMWIPIETFYVFNKEGKSGNISISRILGMLLFGLALVEWRSSFRRIPAAFWLVVWYLGVRALSQLWIPRAFEGRFQTNQMTLIQLAALFLISANLFTAARFRETLTRVYGWWVSLVAVGMVLGVFTSPWTGVEGRNSLLTLDPNVAAGFFSLAAVCLAGDNGIFASKIFLPRLGATLVAIGALMMAILQTGSRGGLLGLAAGVLALAACGQKSTLRKRMLVFLAVAGVLGAMLAAEFQRGSTTAHRLLSTWNTGDTAGRGVIYDAAWAMVRERPLLGYGGANNVYVLGVNLNYSDGGVFIRDTHNLLLFLLTEVGLVGTTPFLAAIALAVWSAWRHGRLTGDAVPFALMCVLITTNTSITGYEQKLFWIIFGAAVACGLQRAGRRAEAHG